MEARSAACRIVEDEDQRRALGPPSQQGGYRLEQGKARPLGIALRCRRGNPRAQARHQRAERRRRVGKRADQSIRGRCREDGLEDSASTASTPGPRPRPTNAPRPPESPAARPRWPPRRPAVSCRCQAHRRGGKRCRDPMPAAKGPQPCASARAPGRAGLRCLSPPDRAPSPRGYYAGGTTPPRRPAGVGCSFRSCGGRWSHRA